MSANVGPKLTRVLAERASAATDQVLDLVIRTDPAGGDWAADEVPGVEVRARAGDVVTASVARDALPALIAAPHIVAVELSAPLDMHDIQVSGG